MPTLPVRIEPRIASSPVTSAVGTPFQCQVYRRFSDLDTQGHVNNVAYADYLQDARVMLLEHVWKESMSDGAQVVVRLEIDYKRPLLFGTEPVTVTISVAHIGNSSYTLSYEVFDHDGTLSARARTVLACVNALGRPTRIPPRLREVLGAHTISS